MNNECKDESNNEFQHLNELLLSFVFKFLRIGVNEQYEVTRL